MCFFSRAELFARIAERRCKHLLREEPLDLDVCSYPQAHAGHAGRGSGERIFQKASTLWKQRDSERERQDGGGKQGLLIDPQRAPTIRSYSSHTVLQKPIHSSPPAVTAFIGFRTALSFNNTIWRHSHSRLSVPGMDRKGERGVDRSKLRSTVWGTVVAQPG